MAGHSKFKNIMHRKGAQDKKRSKAFTKAATEILVAAKSGGDPEMNPRLRLAINNAKSINMPKDRIENAIKKATSAGEGYNYSEMRYEGYAPGGIAIIVEALTDNKNRTASEVRAAFTKHGGALGETGSVSYMFNRMGMIIYTANVGSVDDMMESAIEFGADDCVSCDESHEIVCCVDSFANVQKAFEEKFGVPESAELIWKAENHIEMNQENAEKVIKLIDTLEDSDDVQRVTGNFDISDEILEKISNG